MSATDSASTVLAPGMQVPDFKLATEGGEEFTRGDLQGKTTVLVFYPFAFSPVCTDQLQVYEQSLRRDHRSGRRHLWRLLRLQLVSESVSREARREHPAAI